MKFKVGDKVKLVRIDDEAERYKRYLGEIFTVSRVYRDFVDVEEGQEDSIMPFKKNLELVEYTYEDLKKSPVGTKVRFENEKIFIKIGANMYANKINNCFCEVKEDFDFKNFIDGISKSKIIKIEKPEYSTVYERKEEILDETEKRYLRNVIRPFRNKVEYIEKCKTVSGNSEYILIGIKHDNEITLPNFNSNTTYKGMEDNKKYTIEELGL